MAGKYIIIWFINVSYTTLLIYSERFNINIENGDINSILKLR